MGKTMERVLALMAQSDAVKATAVRAPMYDLNEGVAFKGVVMVQPMTREDLDAANLADEAADIVNARGLTLTPAQEAWFRKNSIVRIRPRVSRGR